MRIFTKPNHPSASNTSKKKKKPKRKAMNLFRRRQGSLDMEYKFHVTFEKLTLQNEPHCVYARIGLKDKSRKHSTKIFTQWRRGKEIFAVHDTVELCARLSYEMSDNSDHAKVTTDNNNDNNNNSNNNGNDKHSPDLVENTFESKLIKITIETRESMTSKPAIYGDYVMDIAGYVDVNAPDKVFSVNTQLQGHKKSTRQAFVQVYIYVYICIYTYMCMYIQMYITKKRPPFFFFFEAIHCTCVRTLQYACLCMRMHQSKQSNKKKKKKKKRKGL
ncbi:hypothetical protein RFI_17575 [Reticulomyxa filosa]|uniref:Uncharacterized protein n=1 Tax=Reticulomyxa filosa TaxID=46433 RepID=X6N2V9_RETFI|nr:hypothetical protein RFI_17575 [Reticulomyxa filosa]|eukprot:ETO19657.1 hypothetical protein RFI_17575 [Reticulomyxa filosa]